MKTIVITGASDGIGAAAAKELTRRKHRVVIVGRDPDKTAAVAARIGAEHHVADFADLDQVRALASALRERHDRIDVLANNAGGVMGERALTVDGYERTFQVNHLAPFLLTHELLPVLRDSRATVIQTSSLAARLYAKFDIADLQGEFSFDPMAAYGNAKLANILFTEELQRRHGDALSAVSFHPGVVGTNFAADARGAIRFLYHGPLKRLLTRTPDKGADQLIWLATATPGAGFEPGAFHIDRKVATKVNPLVGDAVTALELWERSAALLGINA
ncbi:SDR family NAD(P)-dependent oxidoreductase [Demequina sp. NBRC 110051]|uniref:SDR family NAD(P)-dependent oxidoreductase n=1 Tax=Demequina sp. NBRC 110051 TaxID=1570340 RepID=UPI0009FD9B68|nr:SDR family NAD(P)-dependent oxidoreductase [Demequina sp. NBRC 110051]